MKGEINRDYYCSAVCADSEQDCPFEFAPDYKDRCIDCCCFHRKWPTPEQFKEEYGEDYPADGTVYVLNLVVKGYRWLTVPSLSEVKRIQELEPDACGPIACACTPWGKPPDDWRPK